MVGALWTGITGLAGQQTALDNESNNIANVNTIGYKASRISFADQMYQDKIGKGTAILDAEKLYNQGSLKLTGVAYDMALDGDGFFAVSNTRGAGTAETYYTRAGNFRMGDNGTLQDAAGNEVQGWAMSALTSDDIVSTDPNISKFTDDFVKLVASDIINNTNTIETITAKMTDYNESARSDSTTVFTGAGWKSQAAKVADVEALVSSYSAALINYKNDPTAISVTPGVYKNTLNFSNGIANLNGDGDTISVYVDGTKYSQTWDTDLTTTLQKFTDQLSTITGMNAWITDTASSTTRNPTDTDGYIRFESLIPGDNVTISQLAVTTSAGISTPGVLVDNSVKVESGGGYAAVTAARDALKFVATGKQQDVYDSDDLENPDGSQIYTYQLTMYDKTLNQNISIPSSVLSIQYPTNVQDVVNVLNSTETVSRTTAAASTVNEVWTVDTAIADPLAEDYTLKIGTASVTIPSGTARADIAAYVNADSDISALVTASLNGSNQLVLTANTTDTHIRPAYTKEPVEGDLGYYVHAYNINGSVVIETLDNNYDLEFSNDFKVKGANYTGSVTTSPSAGVSEVYTYNQNVAPKPNGTTNFEISDGTTTVTVTGASSIDDMVSKINGNGLLFTASNVNGKLTLTENASAGAGITPTLTVPVTSSVDIVKNTTNSGRTGANAEFLEVKSVIEQAGSRGSLQLKLDTLGISNSPFGDFSVDSTGMITMKQDGATFAVGQIAIALFNDNRGLEPIGDNLLAASEQSGTPIYNLNNNKTASVKANTLELSTADLSESLVNLMVFQRAFEANAKSITTADSILNTLINLKR